MKQASYVIAALFPLLVASHVPPAAADAELQEGTAQVERGARELGQGVANTAEGIGKTMVGGAEQAGENVKGAGEAVKPEARTAWTRFRDGVVAFGESLRTFFTRLFAS